MPSVLPTGFPSRILVIDEDPHTVHVMRHLVGDSTDNRLLAVPDVLGGLRIACREEPAVILLDSMLPGMDQITGLLLLKAHPSTRAAPIVVMTPRLHPRHMEAAYRAGAHAHVLKPLHPERLTDIIQAALTASRPSRSET